VEGVHAQWLTLSVVSYLNCSSRLGRVDQVSVPHECAQVTALQSGWEYDSSSVWLWCCVYAGRVRLHLRGPVVSSEQDVAGQVVHGCEPVILLP
jgi:hypothetical protein